ncbi:DUF1028 domain-containing protein [Streptacidiphilus jiangxiensis]|uniref:Uncharacterized conserved protein, Ntn-hydrolase superfamily n=1 Tax=Streptacidiphilus jiangxiensis TaxID=235985 RepID=A0A1H7V2W2_STRJI|nr:DUF1028 domain-containing protein [Streptacidiphilus jiangxiensis]SEM03552.1 Uncharacterized conserved protein, Ntn-hydrolase superfamily [Streptacidiphilus jiangxiensis]
MTLSLAARCSRTGQVGVVIASSSPAVAARCAHVRAGVGAVCTQNVTDPRLGPWLLDLMAAGSSASDAVRHTAETETLIAWRQLTAVGAEGSPAAFSGEHALGTYAQAVGAECVGAGNMLLHAGVPQSMVDAFTATSSELPLAERLLDALTAGLAAGGEEGPLHSAGLLVADAVPWPVVDLRVDWTEGEPVAELGMLWRRWEPQQDAYVQRALAPERAPSYGVPGDL